MIVSDEKINELLDYIARDCLICPPIYDFNDDRFESECKSNDCKLCWETYIKENPA